MIFCRTFKEHLNNLFNIWRWIILQTKKQITFTLNDNYWIRLRLNWDIIKSRFYQKNWHRKGYIIDYFFICIASWARKPSYLGWRSFCRVKLCWTIVFSGKSWTTIVIGFQILHRTFNRQRLHYYNYYILIELIICIIWNDIYKRKGERVWQEKT